MLTVFFPVFLIFVHSHALARQVDPPTNLTLYCRNLHNVLTWSYGKQEPGLQFKVIIGFISIPPKTLWVNPPSLQADLSFLTDPNEDYYVSVTAVVEGTESASPKGISFSYYEDSPVSQKCFVDLPSVNVTAPKQDIIRFSFVHPWLFHKQNLTGSLNPGSKKRRSHDLQLPEFEYSVVLTNQTDQPHSFNCVESVCEETLPVNAAQEPHCLEITGEMNKMSVIATQDYCASPFKEIRAGKDYYIYIVVACLLLGIILAIICMIVIKKTKVSSSFPDAIRFDDHQKHLTLGNNEQVSVSEVETHSPTPLLSATDTTEDVPVSVPELNTHFPIGVPAEVEDVCVDEGAQDAGQPEYIQGGNFEDGETPDTEEIHSGYETRPVLVRIASDELAQGYRG